MFWKSVNLFELKSSSLVNKLIILYSLTTIAIVIIVCVILFPSFEKITHINNLSHPNSIWEKCIQRLMIAISLSIIAAIVFGNIIARKSMSYIRQFSDKMEKLTLDSLTKEKINPSDWPIELKPLGVSFNIMTERLQKSFSQLSQFSADIAHELRNPIHNILNINEIALTKNNSSYYQEILESNIEECRNLLKLIENLWFLARAEHGQTILNKKVLQGKKEILNICDYYEPYANESDIELVCEGEALLYADHILFKRVISNLLSNALRYTPPGNKVSIKIESKDDFASIIIHDTGIGIEEIHLAKLFDRFYRVDSSRASHTGGLGLGLSIVKSIMDLHGGNIIIESKIHIGTRIYLEFPNK